MTDNPKVTSNSKSKPNYNRSDEECTAFVNKGLYHYHVIQLNQNIQTPGFLNHNSETAYFGLAPNNFVNKRVLDIGALDGVFAFESEKNGVNYVQAIDVEEYEKYDWGFKGPTDKYANQGDQKNITFDIHYSHLIVYVRFREAHLLCKLMFATMII